MKRSEIILSIKELNGVKITNDDLYEGYEIETNKKVLSIVVDSYQSCCESVGHVASNDNFNDFIGAEILGLRYIDNADYNDCKILKDEAGKYVDVFDCAFIDINTNKGNLQFAVYNHHNGCYGHDIRIIEKTKELE